MGNHIASSQSANKQPPVEGSIIAVTLDAVSRPYDLGPLTLAGQQGRPNADAGQHDDLFLTLRADVAWFYFLSPVGTGTVDDTSKDAAGVPLTQGVTHAATAAANEEVRVRVNRTRHRFLLVKGSGAGTLRGWVSSEPSGR